MAVFKTKARLGIHYRPTPSRQAPEVRGNLSGRSSNTCAPRPGPGSHAAAGLARLSPADLAIRTEMEDGRLVQAFERALADLPYTSTLQAGATRTLCIT